MARAGPGVLFRIAVIVAQPLLWWYCMHELSLVNRFWREGVAEHATVIALDHVSESWVTGGTDYYYLMEVAGTRVVQAVGHELELPATIDVLVLPGGHDDDVAVGTKGRGRFDTAVSLIAGGDRNLLLGSALILVAVLLGTLLWIVRSLLERTKKTASPRPG